jgi:pyrroloquinoline-quinone synthase
MKVTPRLLDHPFYRAWERGVVTREELAVYHRSYADLIQNIPTYWQRVVNSLRPEHPTGVTIVQEERDHILLWEAWGREFPFPDAFPRLTEPLEILDAMTPSELLGALHAFEIQQPEVAEVKKETLVRNYGFREQVLTYFDQHMREEPHIAFGSWLAYRFADEEEFEDGFARGSALFFKSLDAFPVNRMSTQ